MTNLDDLFPERRKTLLQIVNKIKDFSFEKTNEYDNVENVLLVQGGYGTGKTFFAKKLNDYLLGEGIDSVYFSAWENDYVNDVFANISINFYKYFAEKNKINTNVKEILNNAYDFVKIIGDLTTNSNLSKLLEFFEKDQKDPIADFKEELAKLISELENKKLVLIVDELDRCRPDYAMKVLEIIKHFFDIDGLIVIILSNIKALNNSVKSLYNFENNNNEESYLTKFFVDKVILNPINYEKFIVDTLSQKLKIDKEDLQKENIAFNSLYILKNSLVKLSQANNITCRELNLIIKKICEFYKIRENNKYNDWQYIANQIFINSNNVIIHKDLTRLQTNINNCIYNNITQYCNYKHDVLNHKTMMITNPIHDYYMQNKIWSQSKEKSNIIFFCFPNILELYSFNTNYIPIQTLKEYFEKAQKRDKLLEGDFFSNFPHKINELKHLLQPYDLKVKEFNDKYGDLDDLKEEDIIKEKEEVDNIIKSILMLNN